ncbi:glutathione S-transferase [Phlyctochytrium arcticum]|nr:glutathione S-transferase [Phlyctochytrium arcticum]
MPVPKSLKLRYFDMAGRAEASRLALHIAAVPFEDVRFSHEEWAKIKPSSPFGQCPYLTIDGQKHLSQSSAILRYIGRIAPESGLYPEKDLNAVSKVDEYLGVQEDIQIMLRPSFMEKDAEKKLQMRKELVAGPMLEILKRYEANVASNGSTFLVNDKVTIADLNWYALSSWFRSGLLDGIPKDFLDQFPTLSKVNKGVDSHPKVADWYTNHKKL